MVSTELSSRALFRCYLHSRGWWLVILAIPVLFALWFVVTIFTMSIARFVPLNVSGYLTTYLAGGIILISYAAALLSLPAVYSDRQYVRKHSEWKPTILYYFMVIPLLNVPIACLYLYFRHRHIGIP
ncbi:hypothetical protein SAMN05421858_4457 [Haladaptatus litoreus]|uniref:Uncharacterized protein n=1 Tax=Haladaptatus litoreus TaxID=553468 RepID=A0A1N7EP72_9EURY|nr:hypothetical protein [Haladaptatus litoreus]SIR89842.1 hypothetical protein SAMN05421858_4457 [Haladaptatus litoreus]